MKNKTNEEIWKSIIGYENCYQVSNFGRVKSIMRTVIDKSNRIHMIHEKIIKSYKDRNLIRVTLYKNGNHRTYSINRLVAEAFILNSKNYKYVKNIDNNIYNNNVNNLKWTNENIITHYSFPKRKVKNLNTNEIFNSLTSAAKKYDLYPQNIWMVCNNRKKHAGGFCWSYI